MLTMKKIKELASIRFQVVLLGSAVLVAVGYLAYYLFKFYRLASSVINDYQEDYDDHDDEQPEPEPDPGAGASPKKETENVQA